MKNKLSGWYILYYSLGNNSDKMPVGKKTGECENYAFLAVERNT